MRAGLTMPPGEWLGHIGSTWRVALFGYVGSVLLTLPRAVALALSPLLAGTVYPILVVVHSTPIVAVAPVIVVALGGGDLPRVVITGIISFFPLVISTATGILATPDELIELSRSLRATRAREITQIRLPYAVPYIFSALKISITLSVIGAVVAEFVAAERGLGYAILFSTSTFKIPQAFPSLAGLVLTLRRSPCCMPGIHGPWPAPSRCRTPPLHGQGGRHRCPPALRHQTSDNSPRLIRATRSFHSVCFNLTVFSSSPIVTPSSEISTDGHSPQAGQSVTSIRSMTYLLLWTHPRAYSP